MKVKCNLCGFVIEEEEITSKGFRHYWTHGGAAPTISDWLPIDTITTVGIPTLGTKGNY